MSPLQGGCLCGAVRFEVAGPISEIEACHCRKCRRAYGAAFAATLYTLRADFQWSQGSEQLARFDAPLEAEAPAYRHCFCRVCGAPQPLCWESLPFVELPVCSLDEAPAEARLAYHQFVTQRAAWLPIDEALPCYERGAPFAEKVLATLLEEHSR